MGYDAVRGIATYGGGCMPGCTRQFNWWRANYGAGSLGCYNPASKAGGGPSLHAEGRAMDIALNAHNSAERARGDAIFERVMRNPEQFGAQEMLWRGYIWSWNRRSEGRRGPGVQQAAHENHVHLGIDVNAGRNWNESWVSGGTPPPPAQEEDDLPYSVEELVQITNNGVERALENNNKKAAKRVYAIARGAIRDEIMGEGGKLDTNQTIQELVVQQLESERGQEAIRKATAG